MTAATASPQSMRLKTRNLLLPLSTSQATGPIVGMPVSPQKARDFSRGLCCYPLFTELPTIYFLGIASRVGALRRALPPPQELRPRRPRLRVFPNEPDDLRRAWALYDSEVFARIVDAYRYTQVVAAGQTSGSARNGARDLYGGLCLPTPVAFQHYCVPGIYGGGTQGLLCALPFKVSEDASDTVLVLEPDGDLYRLTKGVCLFRAGHL